MNHTQYTNDGQQRILRLLQVLAGHEVTGLTPKQVAEQQGCAPALVTRDLANLKQGGFAEQVPETNYWRLGPELVQISIKHGVALGRAQAKLDDIKNRFSRS
jgi:DNA-binding IclR family transcriptional regulator